MPAIVKKRADKIPRSQNSPAKDEVLGSLNEPTLLKESRGERGKILSLEDLDEFISEIETFKKW
jgi:hypothetical protein